MATTIRIPIDLRLPRTTSLAGNSYFNVTNLATLTGDVGHWECVKDVEGKIYGIVKIPSAIDGTPAAKIILEIFANATSGVTRLQASSLAVADAESYDQAMTAETAQDITVPATANLRKEVTFTLTNTPVAEDELLIEIFHDGDHANDTLAVNTKIMSAYLEIDV